MTTHSCSRCTNWRASIRETNGEIVHLLRVAEKKPGTPQAINSLARIPLLKERVRFTRDLESQHLQEVGGEVSA